VNVKPKDHIRDYLALRPTMSSTALFSTFYGIVDSHFLHERWKDGKLVPVRLNNYCEEQCKELRVNRAGLRVVS
jgi:hypothetical protein